MCEPEIGGGYKVFVQQHVNRIFEKASIDTAKLIKISRVLDFNFFSLYCDIPNNVYAYMAAVALGDGNAMNNIGDAALASIIEQQKLKIEGMEESKTLLIDQINGLKDQISQLKSQLDDKNELISIYKRRVNQ